MRSTHRLPEGFLAVVRENVRVYGDTRTFTFVSEERGPGRRYREDVLGFADLDRRARALARHLESLGLRDRAVLLLFPEGLEFLVAFLGCLYARVIAVPSPLPELDAGRSDRTRRIIADADITWILTDHAHRGMLESWCEGAARCLAVDTDVDAAPDGWTMPVIEPDTPAFLQYTSGSTSDPKGVVVTHGNLLYNAEEIKRRIAGDDETVGVGWVPHYHDMGLIGQFMEPLYLGCKYVFTSPITFVKRPVLWLEMISRHRGTVTLGPDFGYELLTRRVTDAQLDGIDLSCLRIAKNGAEPVRVRTLEAMVERFAKVGFRPEVWMPCYGMAETTLLVAAAPLGTGPVVRDFDAEALSQNRGVPRTDAQKQTRRLVGCGRPVTLDVRIVDPQTRDVLPEGHVGEIWVAGGSVARGYWRRPERSREVFEAMTASGEGPFLRTGDLGFRCDGELYITGRIKDLIIVNGHNIYAHDLEAAAKAAHPAARTTAAFAVHGPASHGGEQGEKQGQEQGREQVVIVQEISTAAAGGRSPAELASLTHAAVAREFGLPSLSVVLSGRGAVRRTTSGKVQRQLTRQAFLEGRIKRLAGAAEPAVAAVSQGG
ncbi:fatty acyl-AMP ligase [Actinomadura sp. SCN-SB]|uniref:fatty acyl-AMP ligase n=1 Tax=Actinomadura sp. SCN-SB TaxID=3373092 RepID=UPI0037519BC5